MQVGEGYMRVVVVVRMGAVSERERERGFGNANANAMKSGDSGDSSIYVHTIIEQEH
jgi:hypothetical protein